MTFRSIGVLIMVLVSLLFIMVNWGPILTPMPISFILFTVNAPLGLFLIVGGGLVFLIALMWMLWKQAVTLVDLQKANREAREAREEAKTAEGSRIQKFEEELNAKFEALGKDLSSQFETALSARVEADSAARKELETAVTEMRTSLDSAVQALKRLEDQTNQRLL